MLDTNSPASTESRLTVQWGLPVVPAPWAEDATTWVKFKISCAVVLTPAGALLSSVSVPLLILELQSKWVNQENTDFLNNILEPHLLLSWLFIAVCRTWLLWNSNGQRMDGKQDAVDKPSGVELGNDHLRVVIALLANVSSFSNAVLVGLLGLSKAPGIFLWTVSIGLGLLNYFVDFFTDLADAFRKHERSCVIRGEYIKSWSEQGIIKPFYKYAKPFGLFVREVLPPLIGAIRGSVSIEIASQLFGVEGGAPLVAIRLFLGLPVYAATAYVANNFEVVQMKSSLEDVGIDIPIENSLSRIDCLVPSQLNIIPNGLGQMQSGNFLQIVFKFMLSKSCCVNNERANRASTNIILFYAALGLGAVVFKGERVYIHSQFPEVEGGIATGLGMYGTSARAATVRARSENSVRIAPEIENDANKIKDNVEEVASTEEMKGGAIPPLSREFRSGHAL